MQQSAVATNLSVERILNEWGFPRTDGVPAQVIEAARHCVAIHGLRIGEALVRLELVTEVWVEVMLKSCPAGMKSGEFLAKSDDKVRPHVQRILSLQKRKIALSALDEKYIHPALAKAQSLRDRCDVLNAILVDFGIERSFLFFCDVTSAYNYSSLGPRERAECPIFEQLGAVTVGVLPAPVIYQALSQFRSDGSSLGDSDSKEKVWSPTDAETDAQKQVAMIIETALAVKASDIDIASQIETGVGIVRYRIDGDLCLLPQSKPLAPAEMNEITYFLRSLSGANHHNEHMRDMEDGRFSYRSTHSESFVRASFIPLESPNPDHVNASISMRMTSRTEGAVDIKRLNIDPEVLEMIELLIDAPYGLILLCGPTNTGKTMTIAAMLGSLEQKYGNLQKRLSLEDPVEAYRKGVRHFKLPDTSNPAQGNHLFRAILRHDPDILNIGEIRDEATAYLAISSASSGHLTFSTVHSKDTIDAPDAIRRRVSSALFYDMIDNLSAIIAQRLVKRICPHCNLGWRPVQPNDLARMKRLLLSRGHQLSDEEWPVKSVRANPAGCDRDHCRNGFSGLVPINEVLEATPEVKQIMRTNEVVSMARAQLEPLRQLSLVQMAARRVIKGEIEFEAMNI